MFAGVKGYTAYIAVELRGTRDTTPQGVLLRQTPLPQFTPLIKNQHSQIPVHPTIMETPIIQTAAEFQAKTNYRHLTGINSCFYGLLLIRTLTRGPYSVRYKGS